ncbi:MAG: glucosamine-6-phosphate deaminase [Opitutaceae bacterium]
MLSEYPSIDIAVFPDRKRAGEAAAAHVAFETARCVEEAGRARVVMACAPSQDEFYAALVEHAVSAPGVWKKVEVYHMDEYAGLEAAHPQSFRRYLQERFLDHVSVAVFHPLEAEGEDLEAVAARYADSLREAPIDIVCLGIGENGHIAFNDPAVADFSDPVLVKEVELDDTCRQQQVNDGCFSHIDRVPERALTITLPVFKQAKMLSCLVPTKRKAAAVRDALSGPITPACPASLLRLHPSVRVFLDQEAASLLRGNGEW